MEDLNLRKHVAIDEYPATWQRIIGEWLEENQRDAFWLTYSANYIFSTAGFHWAIDPYSLLSRFDGGKKQDYLKDIAGIKLIILTHAHSDHLDLNLINALKNESITWVIPEFMFEKVVNRIPLDKDRIIVPEPGIPLCIDHLSLFNLLCQKACPYP